MACRYIAVTHGSHVQVWRTPNHLVREFAPFVLHRTYTGHHDDVLSIQWSPDSQCFMTASRDMTARLFTLNPVEGFRPKTFAGHRDVVLGAFFAADGGSVSELLVHTVSEIMVRRYTQLVETGRCLRGKLSKNATQTHVGVYTKGTTSGSRAQRSSARRSTARRVSSSSASPRVCLGSGNCPTSRISTRSAYRKKKSARSRSTPPENG